MSDSEDYCLGEHIEVKAALARRRQLQLCKESPNPDEIRNNHGRVFSQILLDQLLPMERELIMYRKKFKSEVEFKSCTKPGKESIKNINHKDVIMISENLINKFETGNAKKLKEAVEENSEIERYKADAELKRILAEQDILQKQRMKLIAVQFAETFKIKKRKWENYYQVKCNKIIEALINECDEKVNKARSFLGQHPETFDKYTDYEVPPTIIAPIILVDDATQCEGVTEKIEFEIFDLQTKISNSKELCNFLHLVCAYNSHHQIFLSELDETYFNFLLNLKYCLLDWFEQIQNSNCQCCWNDSNEKVKNLFIEAINQIISVENANKELHTRSLAIVIPSEVSKNLLCACESSSSGFSNHSEDETEHKLFRQAFLATIPRIKWKNHPDSKFTSTTYQENELSIVTPSSLSSTNLSCSLLENDIAEEKSVEKRSSSFSKMIASDEPALSWIRCKVNYYLVKIQDYIVNSFNIETLVRKILEKKIITEELSADELENALISAVQEKVHEIINEFNGESSIDNKNEIKETESEIRKLCLWKASDCEEIGDGFLKFDKLPVYMKTGNEPSSLKIESENFIFKEISQDELCCILMSAICEESSNSS